ncbi:GNAT family N-acetyltransferase [Virgibacillus soli]|uniref:GNAT family N-acetyltransferase n=1 Tax=Paracerasibacillus soli TaxID=480284 RepID=A0ABU5CQQ3_9BACI|nr:GNAT family N-acetyltransferase [Virgibacillus soli]MDY0408708.1 GNAT family N-acetyltransferase [Virgibacillus soli]
MDHIKSYYKKTIDTQIGQITIEGPITKQQLHSYMMHDGLTAFRPPNKQYEALLKIADFPEGRIIIARTDDTIIGYVTYLYPDASERWSEIKIDELIVLGAVEVAPDYRGFKVASTLLEVSMMDEYMENYIIISTEYYWHWDLRKTNLTIWQYRNVMEKMMAAGGLTPTPTDDPEIISHPANCLMVRIGNLVSKETIAQFDKLKFLQRYKYRKMRGEDS